LPRAGCKGELAGTPLYSPVLDGKTSMVSYMFHDFPWKIDPLRLPQNLIIVVWKIYGNPSVERNTHFSEFS